ncbi:MAG TPA: extracellular solute-binding protein [Clostridiales bacterium]|nr:extracellular solute-binding protein [Clostridiales bacterium]
MKIKRITKIAVALLIIMAILLAGCDSIGKKNSDEQEVKKKLYFYYPRDGSHIIKRCIIEYNKLHENVEVIGLEGSGKRTAFNEKLNELREAGETVPDIIMIHDTWLAEMASKEILRPLDGGMTENKKNEFFKGMYDAMIWKGKTYGLPIWQDVPLLYYRKDLIDSPPDSWDELSQTAKKLLKSGIEYGLIFPGETQESASAFLGGIWTFYNAYPDFEAEDIKFNEQALSSALGDLKNMVKNGVITPDTLSMNAEDCRMAFEGGNAAFMWNWSYAARLFINEESPLFGKVGVAPLPASTAENPDSGIISGYALAMSKDSGLIPEAWSFMEYLISDDVQREIAKSGLMPAKKSLYNIYWLDQLGLPHVFTELLEAGHALKPGRSADGIINMMSQALSLAVGENKSISDLIKFINEGVVAEEKTEEPVQEGEDAEDGSQAGNNGEDNDEGE